MPKPADYLLSDEENARIFETRIRPTEFGSAASPSSSSSSPPKGFSPARRPVCFLLAGQTGAGKSHAAPALAAALRQASSSSSSSIPYCHLVADTHKAYHPAYAGLVAEARAGHIAPGLASAMTSADARRWLARACEAATDPVRAPADATDATGTSAGPHWLQRDVIVESASRFPDDVVRMTATFRQAGYRVCLVMLAVHTAQSRLGLLARFLEPPAEKAKEEKTDAEKPTLPPRLTPRPIHDESYAGLSRLAEWVDAGQATADAVLVVRRGGWVAHSTISASQVGARQAGPGGLAATLASERNHCRLPAEAATFAADVARLSAAHPERAAELQALASEYKASVAGAAEAWEAWERQGQGQNARASEENSPTLHRLDPGALLEQLRKDDWGVGQAQSQVQ